MRNGSARCSCRSAVGVFAALALSQHACSRESPAPSGSLAFLADAVSEADFPDLFDPGLWDLDPRVGDAIEGTSFAVDGGRRQGILQLFVFNTLNLELFVNQRLDEIVDRSLEREGKVARLTQSGPGTVITQVLRQQGNDLLHEGSLVFDGKVVLSFEHNLATQAFDGSYASPVDSDTRHRAIVVPLADGSFVFGSAYDLLNNGRANYTHIGLVDADRRPLRLLEFFQVNRGFDETSRDLEEKVGRVAKALDDQGAEPAAGASPDPMGAPAQAEEQDPPPEPAAGDRGFPPLLDGRFFELDLAAVDSPGNSGNVFAVVNAVGRNAVADLQPLVDNSKVRFETDAQGRAVEVRSGVVAGTYFESRQTFDGGIQEGVAFVNRRKRLQFVRDHDSGDFRGIIIAPSFDRNAPLCAIVTARPDGTATHLIVEDLANNLRNDYRGELLVDPVTLQPLEFVGFEQFDGGLAAQPESADLVQAFDFQAVVQGF